MIVVTDEKLDRKVGQNVDDLRRALKELADVAGDVRQHRDALSRVGAQALELVLVDRHRLGVGQNTVEPWPTYDELRRLLRLERELRDKIALLRSDLRQMGIAPDLFQDPS